ncbi:MAG: hypothetical protein MUF41_05655 [Sphingopyxis sp.]|nr:hypothetical protein [Sphingopyxis sp.]
MTYKLNPSKRRMFGPAFSLMPDLDRRRAQFDDRFVPDGDSWILSHKGASYRLNRRDYVRASREFDDVIEDVAVQWKRQLIQLFAGTIAGAFLYLGFVDTLVAMLPNPIDNIANVFLLIQPLIWGAMLAWRQEQRVEAIYDDVAARLSGRDGGMLDDIVGDDGRNWGVYAVQAVGLCLLLYIPGLMLFNAITGE